MCDCAKLIENNRDWIKNGVAESDAFLNRISDNQTPSILWIGCSDSRVVPNRLANLPEGELFVHRNIANQTKNDDDCFQASLEFAVNGLKVSKIVVCGHTECGGVYKALDAAEESSVDEWITEVRETYKENKETIDKIDNHSDKISRLSALNVLKQIESLNKNEIVIKRKSTDTDFEIVGMIFNISNGELDLVDKYL